MDIQTIQGITNIAAVLLGVAYVLGGLIVNLHLARYGITEYQVLRVKYLVVGLIFLVDLLFLAIGATILAILSFINFPTDQYNLFLGLGILSCLSAIGLFVFAVFEKRLNRRKIWSAIASSVLLVLSLLAYLFPITVMIRQIIVSSFDAFSITLLVRAALIAFVTLVAQIYYYSAFMYGNESALDPVGMGIPSKVKLLGEETSITRLSHMGIPVASPDMTDSVLLVDETDKQYIVGLRTDSKMQIFKINKELVQGIVYID